MLAAQTAQNTQTAQASAVSAHSSYNNQETFALLEKELHLRGERIALLEARLVQQEQDHRAELLVVRSELNAAQAEVRILSAIPPPPPLSPPPPSAPLTPQLSPQPPVVKVMEEIEVPKVHEPFLCMRCKRAEEEASQLEQYVAVKNATGVPLLSCDVEELEVTAPVAETKTEVSAEMEKEVISALPENSTEPDNEEEACEQREEPPVIEEAMQIEKETQTEVAKEPAKEIAEPEDQPVSSVEHNAAAEDVPLETAFPVPDVLPESVHTSSAIAQPASSLHTEPPTAPKEHEGHMESSEPDRAPSRDAQDVPHAAIAALLSEYGRSAAQVQLLAQDLVYYKQLAEDALRAKAEETLASREAATVAVQACMRRADCEQELEEAVYQLRELQRKHARLTIEYEAEVRRNYTLKARLQLYAQKLSAMEVDYTLSLEDTSVL